jgi:peptidyl-prolyl cis-trans isomerase D
MLDKLRQGAASWFVKILLGLLVVSFAAWGIGDMFRIRTPTWVAMVGEVEIDREEVTQAFRREAQKLSSMFGRPIDNEQAKKLGLLDATVKQLVGGTLLDLEAKKLGMDITEDAIRQAIQQNPAFRNPLGQFDRLQFEQVLYRNGYNERSFVAAYRRDLLREHLQAAVQSGGAVPGEIADRVWRHQMERRVAELAVFANAAEGEVGEPDEKALAQFHQDNAPRFTAPELRAVTVLGLTAEDLGKKIEIPAAELKQEYEQRLREFTREETRDLLLMVIADEAAAKAAHERLAKGEDFAPVAKEVANLSETDIALDNVTQRELQRDQPGPFPAKVFALAVGAVSEPIQSPFGWQIVKVKEVRPGSTESFEQVRDKLKAAIAIQRGGEEAARLSRKVDDELAGGGTLEDIAAKFGLPIFKAAALDSRGGDADGRPIDGLPPIPELVRTAFTTQPGADLHLTDTIGGGYFVLRVDGITPPALRPLDSVKAEVTTAWKEDRRSQASRARASKALEKLNAGGTLADIAKELGGEVKTTEPILRDGSGAGPELSRPLITALFALEAGKATVGSTMANDGHVLARVAEVKAAEVDPSAVQRLQKTLADGMGLDVLAQFSQALEKIYPVKIDEKALESLF